MSERETRREQQRVNAEIKRKELSPAAGEFHGYFVEGEKRQDASLRLDMKDVPDTSAGEVDPVLIPVLSGSLRLTYGNRSDGSFYSFAIQKADFEPKSERLDVVATNEVLKDLVLTLHRVPDGYDGSWSAPASSASGTLHLTAGDVLNLQGETPGIGGAYDGTLAWLATPAYQHASMNLVATQDQTDRFSLSGNLKLLLGDPAHGEALQYVTDQIEFNPLTRRLVMRGSASPVYFIGELRDDAVVGSLYSALDSEIGSLNLQRNHPATPPEGKALVDSLGGVYYLAMSDQNANTRLPPRATLTIVASPDSTRGDNLQIAGNVRLYFGAYGSNEFLELPITQSELRLFSRKLILKAGTEPSLTLEAEIGPGGLSGGKLKDDTFGEIAAFAAARTAPAGSPATMGGDYNGYFGWDHLAGHQRATLTLRPTFSGADKLRLDGTITLEFGTPQDSERLVYVLDAAAFDPVTGLATFGKEGGEITVKGAFEDGKFTGDWTVARLGRMGPVVLSQGAFGPEPTATSRMAALKGSFLCRVETTAAGVNLPQTMTLGFVTSPDLQDPRGLRVDGNMRLYFGAVGSDEYSELHLEQISFDPFTRKLTAVTSGDLVMTVKADLGAGSISGTLTHGALGDVARFQGDKQ